MKRLILYGIVLIVVLGMPGATLAKKITCASIQDGTLHDPYFGEVVGVGSDHWGWNFQAHLFNGDNCGFYHLDSCTWQDRKLTVTWNDAYLSNMDCNGDQFLDSCWDSTCRGSGAWALYHNWGDYRDENDRICRYEVITKTVAVPADATRSGGYWYAADGKIIGQDFGNDFTTVQDEYSDTCEGDHGLRFSYPGPSGFGFYKT